MNNDLRYLSDEDKGSSGLAILLNLELTFGAVTAVGMLGYISWSVRNGMLIACALTQLPTWKMIDPLPVLDTYQS